MSARPTLIHGALVVDSGRSAQQDVLVQGGRIERIDDSVPAPAGAEVVKGEGKILLPGMIDDQVHFREPGLTHKASIFSESRAAVAGGVTSYMEMPNTNPPTISAESIREKQGIAMRDSLANHSFYLGATADNADEIARMDSTSVPGVKVFMGSSTGGLLVDCERALRRILSAAPGIVALHCEDDSVIAANLERFRAETGREPDAADHPRIRDRGACIASTRLAIALAEETGARIHVLHITTAEEAKLFAPGGLAGKRVTAEACVHHLHFHDGAYECKGNLVKCNPAIKSRADRDALWRALAEDRIDVVATDHAPHTYEEKMRPYSQAPAGLPLVQHALPILLELVDAGALTVEQVAAKAAHAPAELFGVLGRGHVREGYWADLVLVDPGGETVVERDGLFYRCGWSPLEGHRFRSHIEAVWVNGRKAYAEGKIIEGDPGMPLQFASAA